MWRKIADTDSFGMIINVYWIGYIFNEMLICIISECM